MFRFIFWVLSWWWRDVLYYSIISYTILFSSSDLSSVLFPSSSSPLIFLSSPPFLSSSSHFLLSSYSSSPILLPSHSSPILIQSIRVGSSISLFIFSSFQQFWPRMFYRSGWLRCVGFISMCSGLSFEFWAGGDVMCYIILLYLILYSSLLLIYLPFYSLPLPLLLSSFLLLPSSPPLPISFSPLTLHLLFFFLPIPLPSSFKVYVSGLPSHYLYSLPFNNSDPACFIGVDGWGV